MKPSQRIAAITGTGSDGWGIFYKARTMIARGVDVTELTIGEHDICTDPVILDAMHAAAKGGATGYALIPGIPDLRAEVAARISAQTGVETTSDNVMITPGGQAGLFAAHMAACDPGDTGIFIDPYYATYPTTLRAASIIPFAVTARAENAFCPRYDDLLTAPVDAKSLLVNSPNNPTGTIYDDATMADIARFVKERDMWLISDEVYDTQIWQGAHKSFRALEGMADRTLVVGSMSKSHAMTGSRLGWVIGPTHMIDLINDLATNTTYGVAGFVQHAALHALRLGPKFEEKIAEPFRRRRDIAVDILRDYPDIGTVPPKGAMYMMLDLRKTGLSGEEFALRLLDERHIAVMPGESFGQAASGHIRVALTIADDAFADAFRQVCDFAQSLMHG